MKRFILLACVYLCFLNLGFCQHLILRQSNINGIYQTGQEIRITAFLNDSKSDSVTVNIRKNFSAKAAQTRIKNTGDTLIIYSARAQKESTLIFEVMTKTDTNTIGVIVDPEEFKPGTERPKDFESYWANEKLSLSELPMQVKQDTVANISKGFVCTSVEINCTGPKPARGYFAKPLAAKPGTLPIVLFLHSAGVSPLWCRSNTGTALRYAKLGKGALSFDLNAHGMLNGQPDSYYTSLENGELKNYAVSGLESKDEIYFRGMYLRLLRTIDFLTKQPEWDGKRILLIGESQGGGQALAAAGLDNRVSAAVVTVPAMCDWGGTLVGRRGSFPYPFSTKNDRGKMLATVPYFDVAHILKSSKATIVAEIGLIDFTCPCSAVYAALNQAKGDKIIFTVPYRAHHLTQALYKDIWSKTVEKPKDDFINNYLK